MCKLEMRKELIICFSLAFFAYNFSSLFVLITHVTFCLLLLFCQASQCSQNSQDNQGKQSKQGKQKLSKAERRKKYLEQIGKPGCSPVEQKKKQILYVCSNSGVGSSTDVYRGCGRDRSIRYSGGLENKEDLTITDDYPLSRSQVEDSRGEAKPPMNVHSLLQGLSYPQQLLYAKKFSIPAAIMMVRLDGNLNVGCIVRNAGAFGFQKAIAVNCGRINTRAMVGAHYYIDVERIATVAEVGEYVRTNRLWPVFLEQGGQELNASNMRKVVQHTIKQKFIPCLVVGSESYGLPDELVKMFPGASLFSIPQLGIVRSLNVASAAAIAMYTLQEAYRDGVK